MSDKARLQAFKSVKRIFEGAYSNLIDFGDDLEQPIREPEKARPTKSSLPGWMRGRGK